MVKKISKGSLLGRFPSSSKDKTGLYLISIVAIVAIVALFLMMKGNSQTSSEEVMIIDEEGNFVGMAGYITGIPPITSSNSFIKKIAIDCSNTKDEWGDIAFALGLSPTPNMSWEDMQEAAARYCYKWINHGDAVVEECIEDEIRNAAASWPCENN